MGVDLMLSKSQKESAICNLKNAIQYYNIAYTFADNEQKKIEYAVIISKLENELQELNDDK